jgi:hypothetical protein
MWATGRVVATFSCSGTSCAGSTWWLTGPLAPAAYQVNAVAVDTAGNRTVSAPRLIYKDATSPTIGSGAGSSTTASSPTSSSPTTSTPTTSTSGDTTPPSASIVSPASGVWTGNSLDITAQASDNVRVTSIRLYGNGVLFGTIPCSATYCKGTVLWLTGSLPSGTHTVKALATDSSGNTKASASITIYK